jgi:predicted DNA binding CopG/RHH family protein
MKPEDFDEQMKGAKRHTSETLRLPAELVTSLKTVAELEGEPSYQTMVRRWIEERLRQETTPAV